MSHVVRHGYGSRLKNSLMGALFGILLFFGSFVLLAWNEYDAIRQTGAITEVEKVVLADVSADTVNAANDGRLIHVASQAVTDEELEYSKFGIREKAVRLRWDTSIYQWEENERHDDDKTTYTYSKEWVDQPIDSSGFRKTGHANGTHQKQFSDGVAQATDVRFGAFELSQKLIAQIDHEKVYSLSSSTTDVAGQVHGGAFYTGDPSNPAIGDEKVEVFIVGPQHDATVMAQQKGSSFTAYETKVGISKEILYLGLLSKGEVINKQRTEAAFRRWMFRGGGFLCMWIGLSLVFSPFRALVSFIPFASRLLEGAIGFVTFFIALGLSSTVIAVAWFAVRPILSGGLLLVAAVAMFLVFRARSEPEESKEEAPKAEEIIEV